MRLYMTLEGLRPSNVKVFGDSENEVRVLISFRSARSTQ